MCLKRYVRYILPERYPDIEFDPNELGWQIRSDGSSVHIDCLFAPIKNYLVVQKWEFGEKTTKYAAMVRSGEIGRDEALERAEFEDSKGTSKVINNFIKIFGLSSSEIEQAKSKTHLVY